MMKNVLLAVLLLGGAFLVLAGGLKWMMIGIFAEILAVNLQEGFNAQASIERFQRFGTALDKNFEILETRLIEHLEARLDELARRTRSTE